MKPRTLAWIAPLLLVLLFYAHSTGNFFLADDFMWLDKVRALSRNPMRAFVPDVMYFDPVVYLSFWLNYTLSGLNVQAYHLVDILVHGLNAVLVYLLIRQQVQDNVLAVLGGMLFGASFATVDAVVWPSSRVDLFAVTFSLLTLICFSRHLATGRPWWLVLSVLCFLGALASKGTPLVVPVFLVFLLVSERRQRKDLLTLTPFLVISAAYLILLRFAMQKNGMALPQSGGLHPNLGNYMLSLVTMFVPERFLDSVNPRLCFGAIVALIAASCFCRLRPDLDRLKYFGLVVLGVGLLPVLSLNDFKIVTPETNPINLLSSPSHRVYLASTGLALFGAALLRGLYLRFLSGRTPLLRGAALLAVAALLGGCYHEVQERNGVWRAAAEQVRFELHSLFPYRQDIQEGSVIVLGNFDGSRGFNTAMIKVYFNLHDVLVYMVKEIDTRVYGNVFDRLEIVGRRQRAAFFIRSGENDVDRIYDLSQPFRGYLQAVVDGRLAVMAGEDESRLSGPRAQLASFKELVDRCGGW